MSDEDIDLETFRAALVQRRAELEALDEGSAASRGTVELDQQRVGRLSRMDAMQQQEMAKASGRRRELELTRIATALARIDTGDYGYCLRCDEPIALARLQIDPAVTLCIVCAEAASG